MKKSTTFKGKDLRIVFLSFYTLFFDLLAIIVVVSGKKDFSFPINYNLTIYNGFEAILGSVAAVCGGGCIVLVGARSAFYESSLLENL